MTEDTLHNQEHVGSPMHARIDEGAERVKQQTGAAAQATRDKLTGAADRLEEGVHSATDARARAAHHTADQSAKWRDGVSTAVDSACGRAGDLLDQARAWVRKKPVESVAIALAAGWLIGRFLRPRR